MNITHCGILFTFDFAQDTSHLNITIPLHSTALLDIQCQGNQIRVLQVISTGEIDVLHMLQTLCLLSQLHIQITSAIIMVDYGTTANGDFDVAGSC